MPLDEPGAVASAAQAAGELLQAGGSPLRDLLAPLPQLAALTKSYGGADAGRTLAQALASALNEDSLSIAEMDELGAWALVVSSFVALLVLGAVAAAITSAAFGEGGLVGAGTSTGDRVLFLGPCRSGKTTLMYRLSGAETAPATVTTMVPTDNTMLVCENEGEDDEGTGRRLKVTDFPGHPRMWSALRQHLRTTRVVLFVVDAADLKAASVQTAAELLFEVLTDAAFCDGHEESGGIVVACNKSDLSTAKDTGEVRRLLEAELEQLRTTRTAIGRAGAAGGGLNDEDDGDDDDGGDGGSGGRVPLGQNGVEFSFATSAPCRVEFVSCSAKAALVGKSGKSLEELRAVLMDVFHGDD